ncbi:hypothetical protein GCM10017744_031910 [Streptomyces antimycoticus]
MSAPTTASGSAGRIAAEAPVALTARAPQVPAERLVAEMVPPPRFATVSFDNYITDPGQPSQAEAVDALRGFAGRLDGGAAAKRGRRRHWFRREAKPAASGGPRGMYLDGGYGVGKTHLLASLWHATRPPPS